MNLQWFRVSILWGILLLSGCGGNSNSSTTQNTNTPPAQINSHQMGGAIQVNLSSLSGTVSTFAGSQQGSSDGTGFSASFNNPRGIATDGTNLFITDTFNSTIRKVLIATGVVTTLAGSTGVSGSVDGIGTAASFFQPQGITTDGTNLFVTESLNHAIRKIEIATGIVTTLAGSARSHGSTDGTGDAARFFSPDGITTDGTNLYVADRGNNIIRKIVIGTGVVTTLAGSAGIAGSIDGQRTAARFNVPRGITTDGINLYVVDSSNHTIRKVEISTGIVTTLAGSAQSPGSADGVGTAAKFDFPVGITTDGSNIFVTDGGATIRKVVIATGTVTTLAGSLFTTGSTDGIGTAANFNNPYGITTDGMNLFVVESGNSKIRKIN